MNKMEKYAKWMLIGMSLYAFGWFSFFLLNESPYLQVTSIFPIASGIIITLDAYRHIRRKF